MAFAPFVPLRVYSSYTMLDGAIDPKGIAKLAKEKDTGARGLRSIIEDIMNDAMFDLPDQEMYLKLPRGPR